MEFSDFNLNTRLAQAISSAGYSKPSDVQEKAIPQILGGLDAIVQAKTGTGKTAAFAIPLLEMADPAARVVQALIVVPTRELAVQVHNEFCTLGRGQGIYSLPVFGGQSINVQVQMLRRGAHILVATPGRLMDLMGRNEVKLASVKRVVLDEADKMFDMGFRDDIDYILSRCPQERQTLMFSATIPRAIQALAAKHQKAGRLFIDVSQDKLTVDEVDQFFIRVDPKRRISVLAGLIRFKHMSKCLVFCRTQRTADWLARSLEREGVNARSMHGGLSQNIRERILEQFKSRRVPVLVSTNLAARGLHIEGISHIINFDFPEEQEVYVHRIGRTARFGQHGEAITFCTNLMEIQELGRIQDMLQAPINEIVELS